MTDYEKLQVCSIISLAQRVIGSVNNDLKEGKTEAVRAKLELLNLELGVYRKDYELKKEETTQERSIDDIINDRIASLEDVVNADATEVIEE